ncbi:hypothetical protein ACOI1C_21815 [Bacillus sp. DJP31]|uniref:hypothetical protein n=1 Tax=Bacillus sp. DJP31 TaxID=3409789 RepID=UPI003BB5D734
MVKALVSLPLIIAIVSYVWARIFDDDDRFPGGAKVHIMLIITQSIVVSMVFMYLDSYFTTLLLSGVYILQSVGVAYYFTKKGAVSCGCFGSQVSSVLSKRLILINILLSIIPHIINVPSNLNLLQGITLLLLFIVTSFVFFIGFPDAIYAVKGYTEKGKRYLYFIRN